MHVMATVLASHHMLSALVCTGGSSLHAVMRLCGGQAVGMIGNVTIGALLSLVHNNYAARTGDAINVTLFCKI